jgi:transposase
LQRRNLLAAAARLARGRRMAAPVAGAARSARTSGPHRVVQGVDGLGQHAGQKGGEKIGPNPVDRGRPGSKRHLLVDGNGTPLVALLTGAQVHDSKVFEELVDGVEPVKGPRGRPRKRPNKLHADKGYDYERCRRFLHRRGIKARIARRGVESSQRLGRHRWVVERTLAWLSCYRRLCVRYERRADIHEAFLELGCALVCFNRLRRGL